MRPLTRVFSTLAIDVVDQRFARSLLMELLMNRDNLGLWSYAESLLKTRLSLFFEHGVLNIWKSLHGGTW